MAYIGRGTENISNVEVLDNLTFNGSASYTLQKSSTNFVPSSANNLLISISGVVQQGNFSVSGSTITFDTTVSASDTCDWILHYGTGLITTVADGAITEAKLGSNAVTTAKINDSAITSAKINNGAITSAKLDSGLALGKIGQVVNTPISTATSTTSTSFVTTNFTASITPSSTSSKIFGLFLARAYCTPANNEMAGQISSASTTPWEGYLVFNSGGNIATQQCIPFYDSPSTTSSVTYTLKIRSISGGNVIIHPNGSTDGTGGFTLMEVLA